MRGTNWVKGSKRSFIRRKRREIRKIKKIVDNELQLGCAIEAAFDGTKDFYIAVYKIQAALKEMDRITKPYA